MKATKISDDNERLVKLETVVGSFNERFDKLENTLVAVNNVLNSSKQTNWPLIFAAITVILSTVSILWFAAIRPITSDVDRSAIAAEKLATAVLIQNDKIADQKNEIVSLSSQVRQDRADIDYMQLHGTAQTSIRLGIIEYKLFGYNNGSLMLK